MENEYTTSFFKTNDACYKPIYADGRIDSYSGKFSINDSSILTRLIQEAGRFCERFASDLFIDWATVQEYVDSLTGAGEKKVFLFGFRQDGVDNNNFVFCRYNNYGDRARHNYRSMWRLDVVTDKNEYGTEQITMKLGRVF